MDGQVVGDQLGDRDRRPRQRRRRLRDPDRHGHQRRRQADQGRQGRAGPASASRSQPLSPAMAKQLGLDPKTKGVLVGDVLPGSPAEKAGLKPGDVITGFNGKPVVNVAGVPPDRGRQRGRQVVQPDLLPRRQGAHDRRSSRPRRQGRLRPGEGGDRRDEAEVEGRARQDDDQGLRPGGPAADPRAGQAARLRRRRRRACSSARSRKAAPPRPPASRRAS